MTYKRYALFCFLLFTNACDNLPTVNERAGQWEVLEACKWRKENRALLNQGMK
jgi:hypothetical protein